MHERKRDRRRDFWASVSLVAAVEGRNRRERTALAEQQGVKIERWRTKGGENGLEVSRDRVPRQVTIVKKNYVVI